MKHKIKPATEKQIAYAKAIAKTLRMKLPKEKTSRAYSAFISEFKPEYDWVKEQMDIERKAVYAANRCVGKR